MNDNEHSFSRLIKICISIIILVAIFFSTDLPEIWNVLRAGSPEYFIIGFLLLTFALVFLQSLRLFYILKWEDIQLRLVIWLTLVGIFFNAFLPSNVGGDAIKIFYLQKKTKITLGNAVTSVILHRLSGLTILLLGGLVYLIFNFQKVKNVFSNVFSFIQLNKNIWILAGILGVFLIIGVLLLKKWSLSVKKKSDRFIKQGRFALKEISASNFVAILFLAALFHAVRVFAFVFFLKFFGVTIEAFEMIFILAVVTLFALLPITIGGLGLVEGAIAVMLVIFGIPQNSAVAVSLLHRFILLVLSLIGGICYMTKDIEKKDQLPSRPS